jgi:lauroyl/myristoyl acyltransferase
VQGRFRERFALDGAFWRRAAHFGASRSPEWFVRYTPPFWGLLAAAATPSARRIIRSNLRLVRGEAPRWREAVDVGRTFAAYAACLAEALSSGSKIDRPPEALIWGSNYIERAIEAGRGIVFTTAHTGGWDIVGPLLSRDHGLKVMLAMHAERDPQALAIQDAARSGHGIRVVHVGADDPLAALPMLEHLRAGGVVAVQIDRHVPGMRKRPVRLFDKPDFIPEGPLRLAQLSGAPLLPVFSARQGYRRYLIEVGVPVEVPRRASNDELDLAGQALADAMTTFVRAHPTQWFHFEARET